MPIFTTSLCFDGYPFQEIETNLASQLYEEGRTLHKNGCHSLLTRLECYLAITGQRLDQRRFRTSSEPKILQRFLAALYSPKFNELGFPWHYARHLVALQSRLSGNDSTLYFPCTLNRNSWRPEFLKLVEGFEEMTLKPDAVHFWKGWTSISQRGHRVHLRLWPFAKAFGLKSADKIYEACDRQIRRGKVPRIPLATDFFAFVADLSPRPDLQDPEHVWVAINRYFKHTFFEKHAQGVDIHSIIHEWKTFVLFLETFVLGTHWAKPLRELPRPRKAGKPGHQTNKREGSNGTLVKCTLLTEIPLQLTDQEAMQALFDLVEKEYNAVLSWANAELMQLRDRHRQRIALAELGTAMQPSEIGTASRLNSSLGRESNNCLRNASATFEAYGLSYIGVHRAASLFPKPLAGGFNRSLQRYPRLAMTGGSLNGTDRSARSH